MILTRSMQISRRALRCSPCLPVVLLLAACAASSQQPTAPAGGAASTAPRAVEQPMAAQTPPVITDPAQLEGAVGQQVELVGTARRAKISAVVLVGQAPVYCTALTSWPEALLGRRVRATGRLTRTDRYKAAIDDAGAISQGSAGGDLVLEGCSHRPER